MKKLILINALGLFVSTVITILPAIVFSQTNTLQSGTVYNHSYNPGYYRYYQNTNYWSVVGIRNSGSTNHDLRLYNDLNFTSLLATSNLSASNQVDFIVCDYNHISINQYDYPKVYNSSGSYYIEWEDGSEQLPPGNSNIYSWTSNHVVRMWDVPLVNGHTYHFILNISSGSADLGFALFKSNNSPYYATHYSGYQRLADSYGSGGEECFTYSATSTDFYGLVVWCNNTSSANYYVMIDDVSSALDLQSGSVYNHNYSPGFYRYNQNTNYWSVVGIREAGTINLNLRLYDDANLTSLLTSSTLINQMDFIVCDYRHRSTQYEYPYIAGGHGSTSYYIEWEDGSESIPAPGNTPTLSWLSNHVIKVWDVYLTSPHVYNFTLDMTSGTANLGMALFRSSSSPYCLRRTDAVRSADNYGNGQDESFTYTTLTYTDWYGLVVWSDNTNSAQYHITITQTADLQSTTPSNIVDSIRLNENHPNPFNTTTEISFYVPFSLEITLDVYDTMGRRIAVLFQGQCDEGLNKVAFNAGDLPSGIYFVRLSRGEFSKTRKVVLIK